MTPEQVGQVVSRALSDGTAYFCDGLSIKEITNERGQRAFALVLWDRGLTSAKSGVAMRSATASVFVFSTGGLEELAEVAAEGAAWGKGRR